MGEDEIENKRKADYVLYDVLPKMLDILCKILIGL
jgi:hypothetical protein